MPRVSADLALFFVLAALWGGSFVAIKFVVAVFPPVFGAMLRVGTAVAALAAFFLYEKKNPSAPAALRRRMWVAGLFAQGMPFALLYWGERLISPGLAGIINGTVPLWTFCLGLGLGRERFTARKSAGLLLGFIGIAVICVPMVAFSGTREELMGTGAVLLMAVCYAVGSQLTRSILSEAKADFRANLFHQLSASAVFLLLVSALLERWPAPSALVVPAALGGTAYLGVFSTAAAFLIYFHLIREWGAVRASAVTYVAPVFAVFWDYVFFRNVPPASQIAAVACILAGVLLLSERK